MTSAGDSACADAPSSSRAAPFRSHHSTVEGNIQADGPEGWNNRVSGDKEGQCARL